MLRILNGARDCVRQVSVARGLLLCEHQCRLDLRDLRLVGLDPGLLHAHLRIDIPDADQVHGMLYEYDNGVKHAYVTYVCEGKGRSYFWEP